jgi:hypothetical protein
MYNKRRRLGRQVRNRTDEEQKLESNFKDLEEILEIKNDELMWKLGIKFPNLFYSVPC